MMASVRVLLLVVAGVSVHGQGVIPGIADLCFEPVEPGICRAYIPSYYFNPLSGSCDCFVYGGCHGNNNRFSNLQDCMDTCSVRQSLQFNTPACEKILGAENPLTNLQFSPHEPGTRANPTPDEAQLTETEAREAASASPAEEPEASETPTVSSVAAPAESEQPVESEQSAPSAAEEESGSSSTSITKEIASLIHGSTGVRQGILKIGQPVLLSLGNSKKTNEEEEAL